ncbi:MAG: hypothetical protein MUO72_05075 [Bacteroidales bacterium]|nr:hypothetical protein [Bacteroidales bacterium]
MKKIKIIAGIMWAILGLFLILILFPRFTNFTSSASKLPFMKINPRYSGGDVASERISVNCTLITRKPVFNGLLKERKTGFVQIDWRGNIPETIVDTIDFDSDSIPDFTIRINTKESTTRFDPSNKNVKGVDVSTPTSYGWAVRIKLKKQ